MGQIFVNTNIRVSKKKASFLCWIAAFWLFLLSFPFFVWTIEPYMTWLIVLPIFLILLLEQSKHIDASAFCTFFLICIWGAICGGSNIVGIVFICTLPFIFSTDKFFVIEVYKRFRTIFVVLISLSLVSYLLVHLGIGLPYYISPPPPRNTIDYSYYIYPFYTCPTVTDWRALGIERFTGLFDEAGTVGTISFLLLFIEKGNFKRIGNIILLVAGILSFSLFFYGALFILLTYNMFTGHVKKWVRILYGIIIAASLYAIATNEITNEMIWKRVQWDSSEGGIVGDDRSEYELSQYVHSIKGTSKYYFGAPEMTSKFNESASIEKAIVSHGFITVALYFLFWAFYSFKYLRRSRAWLLFLVVFFVTMYNRPTMFSYDRLFLLMIAVFAYSNKFKNYVLIVE